MQAKICSFEEQLHPENQLAAKRLITDLPELASLPGVLPSLDVPIQHHDARQANIAWHPAHGAKLVDWSWADPGPRGADTTSLVIDLAKIGFDVNPYMSAHFNRDHAFVLIGFWLAHSLLPTRTGSDTVRFHQLASAVTTYRLLTGC